MSFITDIASAAQTVGKKYGIFPSLIIAQACLESNYGKSGLAQQGKNLFGVKGSYNGSYVPMRTAEYNSAGQKYYTTAKFAKYPNWTTAVEYLGKLYTNGVSWDRSKYKPVVNAKTVKEAAYQVYKCGYCTDPNYGDKLMSIINKYDLTKYDSGSAPKTSASTSSKKKNDNVIDDFQAWLNKTYSLKIGVDGIYGPATKKAAIKGLQKEFNKQFGAKLKVDGIWGPATQSACEVVKKNAKGNITQLIQGMLYSKGYDAGGFDGIFGSGCEAAVKKFQKAKKLSADGQVGEKTFKALFA